MGAFIPALATGLGSLFGGLFGSSAAQKAAQQQQQMLQQGISQIQGSEGQAQGYQTNATNSSLDRLNPYQQAGAGAIGQLSNMLSTPGQGLLTPWSGQFTAPTAEQAAQTPGYQFQLGQGETALQNSAAARGGLLSGQTLGDMNKYAQGLASSNYQNVFNNSLQQYNSAYNSFQQNQANTYNRLSGVGQAGQQAAGMMGNLAQMGAQNYGNITTGAGQDIASLLGAQGRAQAGGTLGSANAWTNAIGGIAGALGNLGNKSPQGNTWNDGDNQNYNLGG